MAYMIAGGGLVLIGVLVGYSIALSAQKEGRGN